MPGVEKGMGAVVLGIVKGKTLLRMYTGHSQFSLRACGAPERVVGLQEEGGTPKVICRASSCWLRARVSGKVVRSSKAVVKWVIASALAERCTACCPARWR